MPDPRMDLALELSELSRHPPTGSGFGFEGEDGRVWPAYLEIPQGKRGAGRRFLAEVFCACGRRSLPTKFVADATDLPDDPVTFDLVNVYRRFGAEPKDSEDGWPVGEVGMRRKAGGPNGDVGAPLDRYGSARPFDVAAAEFEESRNPHGRARAFRGWLSLPLSLPLPDRLVASVTTGSPAVFVGDLEAGERLKTMSTDELVSRIKGAIADYADLPPEEDETWESWFHAAFDMAQDAIRAPLDELARRAAGASEDNVADEVTGSRP